MIVGGLHCTGVNSNVVAACRYTSYQHLVSQLEYRYRYKQQVAVNEKFSLVFFVIKSFFTAIVAPCSRTRNLVPTCLEHNINRKKLKNKISHLQEFILAENKFKYEHGVLTCSKPIHGRSAMHITYQDLIFTIALIQLQLVPLNNLE